MVLWMVHVLWLLTLSLSLEPGNLAYGLSSAAV